MRSPYDTADSVGVTPASAGGSAGLVASAVWNEHCSAYAEAITRVRSTTWTFQRDKRLSR